SLQPGLEGAVEAQEAGPAVHIASRSIGSDIVDCQLRGEVLDDLVVKRHARAQHVNFERSAKVPKMTDVAEVLSTDRAPELRRELGADQAASRPLSSERTRDSRDTSAIIRIDRVEADTALVGSD